MAEPAAEGDVHEVLSPIVAVHSVRHHRLVLLVARPKADVGEPVVVKLVQRPARVQGGGDDVEQAIVVKVLHNATTGIVQGGETGAGGDLNLSTCGAGGPLVPTNSGAEAFRVRTG